MDEWHDQRIPACVYAHIYPEYPSLLPSYMHAILPVHRRCFRYTDRLFNRIPSFLLKQCPAMHQVH